MSTSDEDLNIVEKLGGVDNVMAWMDKGCPPIEGEDA